MSKYKQKVLANLEKESVATQKAVANFLDAQKSIKQRINAFEKCGTFKTEETIKKALAILENDKEDTEIKALAILGLICYASESEEFIDKLINLLMNNQTAPSIKEAALSVLQASTFSSTLLISKKPAYENALLSLVETSNPKPLQMRAAEYLALEKNEHIQRKLIDGLENPQNEMMKPEVAIQLLSYDLHSDFYPTLKKIATKPPNLRAKKEALRNLASDPSSVNLLMETLNNKDEDKEIRHVCAVGLQSLQPELLQNSLKKILVDKKDNPELQVALLNTLNYIPNTEVTDNDRLFQQKLENFTKESSSTKWKKTYKSYINNKSRSNF
jgi:hypothetical protein